MAIIPAAFPSLSSRSVASPSSSRHAPDCAPRCAVPRPRRRAALLAGLVAVGVGASASAQSLPELSLTGAFALRHAPGNDVCPRGEELEASTDKVREGQVLALRVERSATHREAATLRVDFEIVTGSGADASDLGSTRRTLRNVALSFPSAFGSTRRCHHVDIAEDGKLEGNEILSIRLKPRAGAYTVKALSGRRDIRIAEHGAGIRLRYQEIGTLGRTLSGRRFVLRLEAGVARGGSARNCTFVRDTSFTRSIAMQWRVRDGGRSDLRGATLSDFDLPTRVSFRNGVAEVVGVAKLDGDRESEDFQLEREYAYGSAERYPYPQLYCETAADARRYGLEREFFVLSGVIPPALSAPSAPTGLRATATEDRVRLDWTAASDDSIEGWRYRMRIQGVASWFPVELRSRSAGTRAAVLSFSRYLDGIAMEFQVQSYNAVGSSGWSETAGVVLVNEDTPALRVSERAVDVEAGGTRSWTVAVGGPFAGTVRVESSDPGLVRVSPSELRFTRENARVARTVTVTGLTEGAGDVFHTLTLDGTSVATESDEGTTVAVRVTEGSVRVPDLPRAPRGFRARPGDGEVTLTWSAPGDGSILGYEVRRRHGGPGQRWGEWTAVAGSGAGTTAHTVRGLTNGQKYIFRVRAVNGGGEGRSSRPAGATPMGGVVVAVEDAGVVEGDGGRTYLEFVVTLSGEPVDDVKVRVSALAGSGSTATGTSGTGRDFVPLSETVHFAAYGRKEALLKTVRVEVVGDHRAEGDETFVVRLDELETGDARVALAGGGEKLTATGTIIDDDAAPVLADIETTSVVGPDVQVDIEVTATDADGDAIGYRWTRKAGETTPALPEGTDLSSARLSFTPPGHGVYTMRVTADDGHGNTDAKEMVITVRPVPTVSVPAVVRVTEGTHATAVVTVTASRAFGRSVTFDVTYGGTATGAADPASGDYDNDAVTSVTFGASDTTKTLVIPLTDDRKDEAEETITVAIAPASGSTLPAGFVLGNATATVVITDNDASPVLADYEAKSVYGRVVEFTASATDADGDAISYTWTRKAGETTPALPEGTDLSSARLFFTAPDVGVYTMTVTADDGHGNTDRLTVTISVELLDEEDLDDTGMPLDLKVERRRDKLHLSWTAPVHPQRTGWQARYRTFNGSMAAYERWHDWVTIADASATSYVLTSDECLPSQEVQLRATTATGATRAASAEVPSRWDSDGPWGVRVNDGSKVHWPISTSSTSMSWDDYVKWNNIPLSEGDAFEYYVNLRKAPTAPATLTPIPFDTTNHLLGQGSARTPTDKATIYTYTGGLVFTPSNWGKRQPLWVKLEADEDTEDHLVTILFRVEGGGPCYPKDGMLTRTLMVRDMTPTLTFGKAPAVVTEGTPIALTLRSDKPISGYLPVSVTLSDRDASGFSAADLPGALTQTFHVHFGGGKTGRLEIPTRADADASEGVEKYTVTLNDITGYAVGEAVTTRGKLKDGPASGYQGFTGATAMTLALTVTPGELEVSEGGTGSYTVVLDEAPADTVTVTPRSGDTAVATVSGALTFTTANWSTPQTVTVTGVRDDDTDDDTVTVTHVAAMGGTALTVTGGDVAVTVVDTTAALANQVHRAVLPQVAAALASQSLDAVAGRIEAVTRGETGRALRLGTVPGSSGAMLETFGAASDELRPVAPTETGLRELLDGASFALPLGAAESGGGAAAPAAVWGRGERVSLSGSEDGVSWDGGLWSAHVGADVRLGPDVVAGAAVSWSEGAFDTEVDDANGRRVKGEYETELLGLHPYGAWLLSGGTHVWASAGYGQGEVRLEEEEGGVSRSVDVTFASAAVGGRGVLGEDAEWIAGGVTRLALRGEGAVSRMKTEAGAGLSALSAHTRRVRLALEGSHERSLAGEATMTPALELGVRHDGGDARDGAGVEAGASVTWRDPSAGLTLEVRSRVLVAHARDRDEWGVGGRLAVEPTVDGHGLYLTLTPSYGHTATDLHGLFERSPVGSYGAGSGVEAAGRLEGEVGYGLGVWGPGRMGVLSPYAGLALSEGGEGSVRLGGRYTLGAALTVSLEGARREESGLEAEDSVMLRASWRW